MTWFRKKGAGGPTQRIEGPKKRKGAGFQKVGQSDPPVGVLFVEQTPMGELATRLKDLIKRLEPILGFSIKIVERTGQSLQGCFPLASLWEGQKCGRWDCVTCEQKAEIPPPACTRPSLIYENICRKCNPGAGSKGEVRIEDKEHPSVYVGETSRSVEEEQRILGREQEKPQRQPHAETPDSGA